MDMTRRPHKRPAPRQTTSLAGAAPTKPDTVPASGLEATLAALATEAPKEAPTLPGAATGNDTGASSTEVVDEFVPPPNAPPREKTLNELNLEARQVDREHAARREEAERLAREASGHLLEGTLRGRARVRRAQKPVRPPVTE